MIEFRNKEYVGAAGRKSLFDAEIPEDPKAVIVFMHGYKGYKDWGCWNLMQKYFVDSGYGFVKFNVSHNGGTMDDPIDFPDLEAFGQNRYTYELEDLSMVVDETERLLRDELESDAPIYLLGHSRGGGMVIIHAAKDSRIKKVVSLAGISDVQARFPSGDDLLEWEQNGVIYIENGRTKQQMPHYYSFYEDYLDHKELLDIESAARSLDVPFLQVHGDMDLAVSVSEGLRLGKWTDTEPEIIKGAGHTFGSKQPWESDEIPEDLERAIKSVESFFE